MNFEQEMAALGKMLNDIEGMPIKSVDRKSYDKVGFVYDIKRILCDLEFFYKKVVAEQTGDPKTSYYHLRKINPNEHQMIYVNLTRSYPKELFDGHYCYILKKYTQQYVVIPATSVDNPSDGLLRDFEIDILVDGLPKAMRLNIANIRGIDLQRIYSGKGVFDVITDKDIIIRAIKSKIFGDNS